MNNLGAIASYAASRITFSDSNQRMLLVLLDYIANQRFSLGASILGAKNMYPSPPYILLGDPLLRVVPPERSSNMQITALSRGEVKESAVTTDRNVLYARDTASIVGYFSGSQLSGEAQLSVLDSKSRYTLTCPTGSVTVSHKGSQLFRGNADVSSSSFTSGFVVPDDVTSGNTGLAVSYFWDEVNKKDYTSYFHPLVLSDQAQPGHGDDSTGPNIQMYLGTYDFRAGDTVSTSPTLYAKLSDPHGINITGASGHNILLVIDNSLQPIPVTSYFSYDKGSFNNGTLEYQLSGLSEGLHTLQLIAFDNFNNPSVTTTTFIAKQSSALSIERLLIYPNPLSKDGFITFILSADAEVSIGLYTIRGNRFREIKTSGRQGFNSIPISAKDGSGASLANNTYFVKVKAQSATGKSVEQTEKMVIFK
jgi:hypothetical protein